MSRIYPNKPLTDFKNKQKWKTKLKSSFVGSLLYFIELFLKTKINDVEKTIIFNQILFKWGVKLLI